MRNDVDPSETSEWREALSSVVEHEGASRAGFLLEELMEEARRNGAPMPYSPNTPYLNTIPPAAEPPHPTLSETIRFAAEAFDSTITDVYQPKRK